MNNFYTNCSESFQNVEFLCSFTISCLFENVFVHIMSLTFGLISSSGFFKRFTALPSFAIQFCCRFVKDNQMEYGCNIDCLGNSISLVGALSDCRHVLATKWSDEYPV